MTSITHRSLRMLLCGSALALAAACSVTSSVAEKEGLPPQFPVRDFFANPERAYFRLSDDGKTLGFMQPVAPESGGQRRLNVYVQALEGSRQVGEPRKLTSETARDISIYYWKGSDTILYEKDFGGDENFHVVAVDVKSGRITDLTPGDKVRASIQDDLPEDADHILVAHNRRNAELFDVYRIDLGTGKEEMVAQNPGDIVGWQTDHAGRVRMAVRSAGLDTITLYRPDEKSDFKPIITTDYKTQVDPAFFTADNSKLYMISNRGRDKRALVMVDPARPDAEEVLFVDSEVDAGGADWSRARKRLTMVVYEKDRTERKFFDPYLESVFTRLKAKLPGMEFILQNSTKAEDKFIVAAFNDHTPGARYIYDAKADTLSKLGDINPKIPADAMAPMKPIQYQSRDGLTIRGFLTLPRGREPRNLACIVNPHGGPWARDAWGYDPQVQLLANRGYAVLQVNYRGSTGFGKAFTHAAEHEFAGRMHDDLIDGVGWLVGQGIADRDRVGIYGGSYGGYAALVGASFTPDVFAAAVSVVGPSSLVSLVRSFPAYWRPFLASTWFRYVGDPEDPEQRADMEARSPLTRVADIRCPLLVIQGANDPRVTKAESDQIVAALRARGVTVEYLVKEGEGHGFVKPENRLEAYGAIERFFATHLGGRVGD